MNLSVCIEGGLLECLIDCSPANPIMAGCEVQDSGGCSVCKAGCITWSLVYAGIPKDWALIPGKEWTCWQGESKQAESKRFFFHVL